MLFNLKKILPKKILWRLLIIFFVPLIFIQCLGVFLFYERHWEKITTRFANIASNQINFIISDYKKNGISSSKKVAQFLNIDVDLLIYDNELFITNKASFFEENIKNTFNSRLNYRYNINFNKDKIIIYIDLSEEILKLTVPKKYLLSQTPIILFLWIISSFIFLSIIAFLFLRIQVRAITRLAKFSEDFGYDKETKKFKPEGAIEIRMAGNAFIKMKKRIKNQINNRASFLAGISHDLGTMLTRIKLQIELVNKISDVDLIKKDVISMQALLKEYLEYSENSRKSEKIKNINLKIFFENIINVSKKFFKKKKILFKCKNDFEIKVKENSLSRVFSNIFYNALKFGDIIKVGVEQNEKRVSIIIEDNGVGIPKKNRKDIFKPFFKLDRSRNLNYIGSGLGLSIAQEIITKMGGRISVQDSEMNGAKFTIFLPKNL